MSVFVESNIEFDFTNAASVVPHDKITSLWPGVDFRIEDGVEWIWLEIKSWDLAQFPAERRGGQRRSFICKMESKNYTRELRGKFLGTTAYLAWTGQFTLAPTRLILLFEPPKQMDAALLVTQSSRIKGQIPNLKSWSQPITTVVLTLQEWNARFPDYSGTKLP